jgi:hypothetical protein
VNRQRAELLACSLACTFLEVWLSGRAVEEDEGTALAWELTQGPDVNDEARPKGKPAVLLINIGRARRYT